MLTTVIISTWEHELRFFSIIVVCHCLQFFSQSFFLSISTVLISSIVGSHKENVAHYDNNVFEFLLASLIWRWVSVFSQFLFLCCQEEEQIQNSEQQPNLFYVRRWNEENIP